MDENNVSPLRNGIQIILLLTLLIVYSLDFNTQKIALLLVILWAVLVLIDEMFQKLRLRSRLPLVLSNRLTIYCLLMVLFVLSPHYPIVGIQFPFGYFIMLSVLHVGLILLELNRESLSSLQWVLLYLVFFTFSISLLGNLLI